MGIAPYQEEVLEMLTTCKCKRCGKELLTMVCPIHSSTATMHKYQGICRNCMTETEFAEMMLSMNEDVSRRIAK